MDRLAVADAAHVDDTTRSPFTDTADASNAPDINAAEMRFWEVEDFSKGPTMRQASLRGPLSFHQSGG